MGLNDENTDEEDENEDEDQDAAFFRVHMPEEDEEDEDVPLGFSHPFSKSQNKTPLGKSSKKKKQYNQTPRTQNRRKKPTIQNEDDLQRPSLGQLHMSKKKEEFNGLGIEISIESLQLLPNIVSDKRYLFFDENSK